jgi:hypothetical protein
VIVATNSFQTLHLSFLFFSFLFDFIYETASFLKYIYFLDLKVDDIGTHSIRKGAATYISTGTTDCPPSMAIRLRAGWTLGGVMDRYIFQCESGDCFVGRLVSGLPILSANFGILPPHFEDENFEDLNFAIRTCFPCLPNTMTRASMFLLASVVHHSQYLQETLPSTHPLFATILFTHPCLLSKLRSKVKCSLWSQGAHIQPTGLPTSTILLQNLADVNSSLKGLPNALENLGETVVKNVIQSIDDKIEALQLGMHDIVYEINRFEHF